MPFLRPSPRTGLQAPGQAQRRRNADRRRAYRDAAQPASAPQPTRRVHIQRRYAEAILLLQYLPLANCSSIFCPSSITIWARDLRSGARISSILVVVGPVDDREGHDSLCWMYGLSTNVGRAGRSRHEHRICLVSKMRMPIRGVNVRYDHLWIQQNDDVVSEEADCVDKEFVFGQQDRAGLSDSKRGTNDRHINLAGA